MLSSRTTPTWDDELWPPTPVVGDTEADLRCTVTRASLSPSATTPGVICDGKSKKGAVALAGDPERRRVVGCWWEPPGCVSEVLDRMTTCERKVLPTNCKKYTQFQHMSMYCKSGNFRACKFSRLTNLKQIRLFLMCVHAPLSFVLYLSCILILATTKIVVQFNKWHLEWVCLSKMLSTTPKGNRNGGWWLEWELSYAKS